MYGVNIVDLDFPAVHPIASAYYYAQVPTASRLNGLISEQNLFKA